MSDYQLELVVSTYFNTIIEAGIKEYDVEDWGEKDGNLYIILKNGNKIIEKIKNFY
jgi:hypothetical protein